MAERKAFYVDIGSITAEEGERLVAQWREAVHSDESEMDDTPLDYYPFSVRTANALLRMGVKTFGQLGRLTDRDLHKARDFGRVAWSEVHRAFQTFWLPLGKLTLREHFALATDRVAGEGLLRKLREFRESLPVRERAIWDHRVVPVYLMHGQTTRTLEDIAEQFSCKKQRILDRERWLINHVGNWFRFEMVKPEGE